MMQAALALVRAFRGMRQTGFRMVLEAGYELARARLATCLPAATYLAPAEVIHRSPTAAYDPRQVRAIGQVIEAVARRMPFRARCLQQALATGRMLRRRGYAPSIYLAVNMDRAGRAAAKHGRAAHAWVSVDDTVACGGGLPDGYAMVAQIG